LQGRFRRDGRALQKSLLWFTKMTNILNKLFSDKKTKEKTMRVKLMDAIHQIRLEEDNKRPNPRDVNKTYKKYNLLIMQSEKKGYYIDDLRSKFEGAEYKNE